MKKIKKRGAVYGVIALLLCTAAYLNWSYVEPPEDLLQTDGSSADSTQAASGDSTANIVVSPPEGGLQATDVTKIRDIVVSETGMSAGQIKIVEAGS